MPRPIELSLDAAGNLVLSDNGTTEAGRIFNRNVSWKIKGTGIESFKIVGKNPGDPFTKRPSSSLGRKLDLVVSPTGTLGDWEYSIIWVNTLTPQENSFDPKISVRPVGFTFAAFVMIAATALSLSAVIYFRRSRIRK